MTEIFGKPWSDFICWGIKPSQIYFQYLEKLQMILCKCFHLCFILDNIQNQSITVLFFYISHLTIKKNNYITIYNIIKKKLF